MTFRRSSLLLPCLLFKDKVDDILNGFHHRDGFIRNGDVKRIFKFKHELDGIERLDPQILLEPR